MVACIVIAIFLHFFLFPFPSILLLSSSFLSVCLLLPGKAHSLAFFYCTVCPTSSMYLRIHSVSEWYEENNLIIVFETNDCFELCLTSNVHQWVLTKRPLILSKHSVIKRKARTKQLSWWLWPCHLSSGKIRLRAINKKCWEPERVSQKNSENILSPKS